MFDQIAWPGVQGTQSVLRALTWLAVLKVILVLLINAHLANLSLQNVRSWPKSAGGCQADFADSWRPTRASSSALRLGLLSYLKCIIDFDAEVSYCTFQLGMSQK